MIGAITLRLDEPGSGRVGYWLAPAFWGTGYASEALGGVVGYAREAGFRTVTARSSRTIRPR